MIPYFNINLINNINFINQVGFYLGFYHHISNQANFVLPILKGTNAKASDGLSPAGMS